MRLSDVLLEEGRMSDQDFWEELADIIKMGHVETCLGTDKIIALDCVLKAIYETMATIAPQFVDGKNQFMLPAWDSIVYFADSLSTRLRKITNSESNTVSPLADGDFKSDLFKKLRDPIYARGYIEAARSEGEGCLEAARNNVREALGLQRPSPLSKEPLVEVGNGIGESVSPAVNEDMLLARKQLAQPHCICGATRMEIDAQPEALFEASGVKRAEELGGFNVKESWNHLLYCPDKI